MATTKTKNEGPVGLTLYFEGTKFIAKLVKRVAGRRYRQVGDIIEGAFNAVFGDVDHVSGSTSWYKKVVTAEEADEVARRLRLCDEVLSVVYSPPAIRKKNARPSVNRAAIEVLKTAIHGDGRSLGVEGSIADAERSINNLQESLRREQNALEGLKARREQLLETIRSLETIKSHGV